MKYSKQKHDHSVCLFKVSLLQSPTILMGMRPSETPSNFFFFSFSFFLCTISEKSHNSHNFLSGCNLCLLYGLNFFFFFFFWCQVIYWLSQRLGSVVKWLRRREPKNRPFSFFLFSFHSIYNFSLGFSCQMQPLQWNNDSPRNVLQTCVILWINGGQPAFDENPPKIWERHEKKDQR